MHIHKILLHFTRQSNYYKRRGLNNSLYQIMTSQTLSFTHLTVLHYKSVVPSVSLFADVTVTHSMYPNGIYSIVLPLYTPLTLLFSMSSDTQQCHNQKRNQDHIQILFKQSQMPQCFHFLVLFYIASVIESRNLSRYPNLVYVMCKRNEYMMQWWKH